MRIPKLCGSSAPSASISSPAPLSSRVILILTEVFEVLAIEKVGTHFERLHYNPSLHESE